MIRVLAFDLSLTATGVCDPDGGLDTMKLKSKDDDRLLEVQRRVRDLVFDLTPDLVTIEGPVVRSAAAVAIGMLHGAVRTTLLANEFPYLVVPPASVKTYATGRGNATKPDMRMELYKRTGSDVSDDNQVDAWWLWALGLDLLGEPPIELPQSHRRALAKLASPIDRQPHATQETT